MTPDELRAYITERIAADADIRRVLSAITAQTADLFDSQAYALRSGEISGKALAAALLDLDASERSASVFGILWDRYRDENRVFDEIQAILDKQLGIQLAPQHAAFPEARAKDMANALCDDTADPETLRRRAGSAGNIIAAMHDGNVRANAEFRDRAGLQCSAIREGGAKCCEWCASVSGKYPASDTPQGFWGRHDNCKCSILYETRKGVQRLGGSTKKWEPLEDAGAPEPTRLTAEQAAELEAKHLPKRLTPTVQSGTMVVGENGLTINSRQFGKKVGKHAIDFGLNPKDDQARQQVLDIIVDIRDNPDMVVDGRWRGQGSPKANGSGNEDGDVTFYIKGTSVLVCNQNEFVTVMRDAINSGRVQEAIKKQRGEE